MRRRTRIDAVIAVQTVRVELEEFKRLFGLAADRQGEGDYEAARRFRKAEEDFVRNGPVEEKAHSLIRVALEENGVEFVFDRVIEDLEPVDMAHERLDDLIRRKVE